MSGHLLWLNQGAYNCFSRSPLGMSERNILYLGPMTKSVLKEKKKTRASISSGLDDSLLSVFRIALLARTAIYSRRVAWIWMNCQNFSLFLLKGT